MKRLVSTIFVLFSLATTLQAGFFSSMAGSVAANAMTGTKAHASTETKAHASNSKDYTSTLSTINANVNHNSQKINILSNQLKTMNNVVYILLFTNIIGFILIILLLLRKSNTTDNYPNDSQKGKIQSEQYGINVIKEEGKAYATNELFFKIIAILNIGLLILILFLFSMGIGISYYTMLFALIIPTTTFVFSIFNKKFIGVSLISSLFILISFGLAYGGYIELYDFIKLGLQNYIIILICMTIPLINIIFIVINRKKYFYGE